MSVHTMGGVNYVARNGLFLTWDDGDPDPIPYSEASISQKRDDQGLMQQGWFCRWELPTTMGGPTPLQMHGSWIGPFASETTAVSEAQEDFVGVADEPFNTEYLNDR